MSDARDDKSHAEALKLARIVVQFHESNAEYEAEVVRQIAQALIDASTPSHALPSRESDRPNLAAAIALHELHGSLPSTTRRRPPATSAERSAENAAAWAVIAESDGEMLEVLIGKPEAEQIRPGELIEPLFFAASATACSADAKDAARYRYMRSSAGFQDRNGPGLYWYLPRWNAELPMGERLDAAIDAALRRPDGGKQA